MGTQVLLSPTPSGDRLTKLLKAEEMDPLLLATANLYLQEKSVHEIAQELNIREDRVSQILSREEVKTYIENCMLSQGFLNPLKSLKIMESVIESLIAKGIEEESMTSKDLLDWMKELRQLREGLTPKKSTPTVAVQVNNNLDRLYQEIKE